MPQEYIKFSHDYKKLDHGLFPTIRRKDNYPKAGEYLAVKTPSGSFLGQILMKSKMKYVNIPTAFLCYDTGADTRDDAELLFNQFYRKPLKLDEILTVLFIRKVDFTRKVEG